MTGIMSSPIKRGLGVFILVIILLAGCAPSQQEMMAKDSLERARAAYLQAKADPKIEAFAPLPLADAGKAVEAAEAAKNYEEKQHLAYVAEKKTQIAVAMAEAKMAEQEAEKLSKETAEVLLQKRDRETTIAKQEAEEAKRTALAEMEKAERAKKEAAEARLAAQAEAERAARAKAESEQLVRELSELKARQTERGIVLTIGDVLFATGKATLSAEAARSIGKLADFLQKYPNRNALIEGHTDRVGKDELNLALSQKRADAVKEKLVAAGVDAGRVTTIGYGKQYPVASNDTAAGKQQNRRVEVIILNEGVNPETQFRK